MQKATPSSFTLGGLSLIELARRTIRESWHDEVFGQAGRMAFYHFLAIFPALLVFLALAAHIPYVGEHLKNTIQEMSSQILPNEVSQLFQSMVTELDQHARSHVPLLPILAGAAWAGLNGTWALVYGLNIAYEVEETRPTFRLAATIAGLAFTLAVSSSVALALIFIGRALRSHLHAAMPALHAAEWTILACCMLLTFAVLYRFAPNLANARWQWSLPGALCALVLWIAAIVGARIYFGHFNDYSRSYGHLNSAVMLLLWLYLSNAAILIGGELNSEIEKALAEPGSAIERGGRRRRPPPESR